MSLGGTVEPAPPIIVWTGKFWGDALRGLAVGFADRHLRQLLVGGLFLGQCLLEQWHGFVHAELLGPGSQRTVASNFVMLYCLRRGYETRVEGNGALEVLHDRLAFLDDPKDGVAGFAAGGL